MARTALATLLAIFLTLPALGQSPRQPPEPAVIVVCHEMQARDRAFMAMIDREPERADLLGCAIVQPLTTVSRVEARGVGVEITGQRRADFAGDWIVRVRVTHPGGTEFFGIVWIPQVGA